ncbi:MAG: hypothetical protein IGR76_04920 [Synechococcales cyanobacterium T60_A2020_003]|nr:hypothetical protein [Synechococcales cyanobacterium T60_A2020_003]
MIPKSLSRIGLAIAASTTLSLVSQNAIAQVESNYTCFAIDETGRVINFGTGDQLRVYLWKFPNRNIRAQQFGCSRSLSSVSGCLCENSTSGIGGGRLYYWR